MLIHCPLQSSKCQPGFAGWAPLSSWSQPGSQHQWLSQESSALCCLRIETKGSSCCDFFFLEGVCNTGTPFQPRLLHLFSSILQYLILIQDSMPCPRFEDISATDSKLGLYSLDLVHEASGQGVEKSRCILCVSLEKKNAFWPSTCLHLRSE